MSTLNQQYATDANLDQLQVAGLVELLRSTLALSEIEGNIEGKEEPLAPDADIVLVFAGLYALNKSLRRWLPTDELVEESTSTRAHTGPLLR
jgi:hypothetical protein